MDTMSEIIKERVKNSIGKYIKVFLMNGFRYAGKLTNYDNKYIEILDVVSSSFKLLLIEDIKDMEVKE